MASIRDLTCIRSVEHMAEYGKYEEEFIVYGCSCMERGKLVYRVSPHYREIAKFVTQSVQENRLPSPVHTLMRRCVVQTGQREQLLYDTELELARTLQKAYSRNFFHEVNQCMQVMPTNAAKPIFDELRFQLNGIFSEEYLQLFEGLVSIAYQARLLTTETVIEIQQWVQNVKKQMEHDIVAKKTFQRTFYGLCYIDANGRYQYKSNAQEYMILEEQRKLKRQKYAVSPIFQKTYWYGYGIEPKTIKEQFKKELITYYGELYWVYWNKIKQQAPVVSQEQYAQALQRIEMHDTKEAYDAFMEYGYNWNMYHAKG